MALSVVFGGGDWLGSMVVTRGWSQETEGGKSKVSMSGSKRIFLQAAANAYDMHEHCRAGRLPTELVYNGT